MRASDGTVRFDLLRRGRARVCVWQDDVVGVVIIAPMSAGEMMRVASGAYAALNLSHRTCSLERVRRQRFRAEHVGSVHRRDHVISGRRHDEV